MEPRPTGAETIDRQGYGKRIVTMELGRVTVACRLIALGLRRDPPCNLRAPTDIMAVLKNRAGALGASARAIGGENHGCGQPDFPGSIFRSDSESIGSSTTNRKSGPNSQVKEKKKARHEVGRKVSGEPA